MIEHAALHWDPPAFGLAATVVCLVVGLLVAAFGGGTIRLLRIMLRRRPRSRREWDRLLRERLEGG